MTEQAPHLQHFNVAGNGAFADTDMVEVTPNKVAELKSLHLNNRNAAVNTVSISDGAIAAARHIIRVTVPATSDRVMTEEELAGFRGGAQGDILITSTVGNLDVSGSYAEY